MSDNFRASAEAVLPAAWRCLRRFGVERQEMEDALQEVLLQLIRHWVKSSLSSLAEIRAFACLISVNVSRDFARARKQNRGRAEALHEGLVDRSADPAALGATHESIALVDKVLATMDAERREVFILYEIEGFTA